MASVMPPYLALIIVCLNLCCNNLKRENIIREILFRQLMHVCVRACMSMSIHRMFRLIPGIYIIRRRTHILAIRAHSGISEKIAKVFKQS